MTAPAVEEGSISVPGGTVAFRIVGPAGNSERAPLLVVHGGPGMAHDYLESLEALADERRVAFWDQLGCGRSDRPDDPSLWTVDRSVQELEAVRSALGLERFHLFGNSWGGWLALQFALDRRPAGLVSLTVSSSPASVRATLAYMTWLKHRLPADVLAVIEDHESRRAFDCPEYTAAVMVFYKRHLCRLERWPAGVEYALGSGFGVDIYRTMWGPSEFGPVTGVLRDWDVSDRLGEIDVPTLITVGRHDEMSPDDMAEEAAAIPGAELEIFEHSSHMAFAEEPDAYVARLRRFLASAEARAQARA